MAIVEKPDMELEKHCENCARELFGRTDKRFCNDNCRNEFNRRKSRQQQLTAHADMPEILRIIKRNYEILLSFKDIPAGWEIYVAKNSPSLNGFDYRFYTSVKEYDGERYHFCFERGWKEVDGTIYIKDDARQAKI